MAGEDEKSFAELVAEVLASSPCADALGAPSVVTVPSVHVDCEATGAARLIIRLALDGGAGLEVVHRLYGRITEADVDSVEAEAWGIRSWLEEGLHTWLLREAAPGDDGVYRWPP